MWFSIGVGELCLVSALFFVAGLLALLRVPAWRWALVAGVSGTVAAIVTPADPASTILLGIVFGLFFVVGRRTRSVRSVAGPQS